MLPKATRYCLLLLFCLVFTPMNANDKYISINDYIEKYKHIAIEEMERSGIPASIKLGQGIMESNHGNSKLARNSNNHFGIKCKKEWTGKKYYHKDDDRDKRGRLIHSCFRVYSSVHDSYVDHSNFLMSRDRYAMLFAYSNTDYKSWANGLKKAGYATAKHYATKLIQIIEANQLYLYDNMSAGVAIMGSGKDEWQPVRPQSYKRDDAVDLKGANLLSPRRPLVGLQVDNELSGNLNDKLLGVNYFQVPKEPMFINNGLIAVALQDGQSLQDIAKAYNIKEKKLRKYNEIALQQPLIRGQYLYLETKKKENSNIDFHTVKDGETLYIIAQMYGLKLDNLKILNPKLTNKPLNTGNIVKLNKKKLVITPAF